MADYGRIFRVSEDMSNSADNRYRLVTLEGDEFRNDTPSVVVGNGDDHASRMHELSGILSGPSQSSGRRDVHYMTENGIDQDYYPKTSNRNSTAATAAAVAESAAYGRNMHPEEPAMKRYIQTYGNSDEQYSHTSPGQGQTVYYPHSPEGIGSLRHEQRELQSGKVVSSAYSVKSTMINSHPEAAPDSSQHQSVVSQSRKKAQKMERPPPKESGRSTVIRTSNSSPLSDRDTMMVSGGNLGRARDDARRKQHNEVERRRRDKINTWIAKLAKVIPECGDPELKDVKSSSSKGAVLAKCYQHIIHLQRDNEALVKKIDSTPVIPEGATVDERYAITINAMDEEINRLQKALNETREDRDDIIRAVKKQGVDLEFGTDGMDHLTADDGMRRRDHESARGFCRSVEEENMRLAQYRHEDEEDDRVRTHLTTPGNGMLVITDKSFEDQD